MKKYRCTVCGWVYDPAIGDADSGIAPNTPFEDIPDEWVCPLCGVGKEDFEPVEEQRFAEIIYKVVCFIQTAFFVGEIFIPLRD